MKVLQLRQLTERQAIVSECADGFLLQNPVTRQYFKRAPDHRGPHLRPPPDLFGFIDSSLFLMEMSESFGEILEVPDSSDGEALQQEFFGLMQVP